MGITVTVELAANISMAEIQNAYADVVADILKNRLSDNQIKELVRRVKNEGI